MKKWSFFPHVEHSINPRAFNWMMGKMATAYVNRHPTVGTFVFRFFNQWQRMLLRFYRA